MMHPNENIKEVLGTFRKRLPLQLRAHIAIPNERVNLEAFLRNVIRRSEELAKKHLTAREYKRKFKKQ